MKDNTLTLTQVNDEVVVDSRLVADEVGIEHKQVLDNIRKYITEFRALGQLAFQTRPGDIRYAQTFCYLNEDQATFLMSLSRNTPQVVALKLRLVQAFSAAKKQLASKEVAVPTNVLDVLALAVGERRGRAAKPYLYLPVSLEVPPLVASQSCCRCCLSQS